MSQKGWKPKPECLLLRKLTGRGKLEKSVRPGQPPSDADKDEISNLLKGFVIFRSIPGKFPQTTQNKLNNITIANVTDKHHLLKHFLSLFPTYTHIHTAECTCMEFLKRLISEEAEACVRNHAQYSRSESTVEGLQSFVAGDPHKHVHYITVPGQNANLNSGNSINTCSIAFTKISF